LPVAQTAPTAATATTTLAPIPEETALPLLLPSPLPPQQRQQQQRPQQARAAVTTSGGGAKPKAKDDNSGSDSGSDVESGEEKAPAVKKAGDGRRPGRVRVANRGRSRSRTRSPSGSRGRSRGRSGSGSPSRSRSRSKSRSPSPSNRRGNNNNNNSGHHHGRRSRPNPCKRYRLARLRQPLPNEPILFPLVAGDYRSPLTILGMYGQIPSKTIAVRCETVGHLSSNDMLRMACATATARHPVPTDDGQCLLIMHYETAFKASERRRDLDPTFAPNCGFQFAQPLLSRRAPALPSSTTTTTTTTTATATTH
jgi:hypothetical protein